MALRPPSRAQGNSGSLGSLLLACAATLFIASRLYVTSREIVHLRSELAAAHAAAALPGASPASADQWGVGVEAADVEGPGGALEHQPLLFYSVRPLAAGAEPGPLQGAALEADPLPIQWDPSDRIAGQVHLVEAGRVHGFACLKGSRGAALEVVAYVDGVEAGRAPASLPSQAPAVDRLCQLEAPLPSGAMEQQQQQPRLGEPGGTGVGFVVPLPPLPAGVHTLRVFAVAPDRGFKQELGQSPLAFRESAASPDQEERIRRKDAIITTRNAQVASLWDELHTRQPWRNAVGSGQPVRPFSEDQGAEQGAGAGAGQGQGQQRRLVLYIGINSGLTSRKRRDILRRTWAPAGKLGQLEAAHGARIRFFIGRSHQQGDKIERELEAEAKEFGDIERLEVVDEYGELSRKTARLFSQMSDAVHADFYFKVDDDVAVNVPALAEYLRERRSQGNLYLGCMKSGEVLTDKRWKWYEPEHWRFGDAAGADGKINYMRHATGQIYGVARPVARYIARNEAILHRYANEDVGVGAWLVGLDIQYDNQHRLCCDNEWKCTGQSNKDNVCLAFNENQCAGLCRAEERLEGIYRDCVADPFSAGKKGKLPWWGTSGWATSRAGSTASLATIAAREQAKTAVKKASSDSGAGNDAGAGTAAGTGTGTAAGTATGTAAAAAAGRKGAAGAGKGADAAGQ